MKNRVTLIVVACLLLTVCALAALSRAQEQKSQRYAFWEIIARPGQVLKYEAAMKKEIALGWPYPWSAYSTDDFHYYYLTPIENFGEIDNLLKMDDDWMAKLGDQWQELSEDFKGAYEYYRFGVLRLLPELSYTAKKPGLKPEEAKYVYWSLCSIERGKEKEFEDVLKEWVELLKSKDIPTGFTTYVGEMGMEMPFYFMAWSAKSAVDFFAESDKAYKKVGEKKVAELWLKEAPCYRKYETKAGRPRPDLANTPKGK